MATGMYSSVPAILVSSLSQYRIYMTLADLHNRSGSLETVLVITKGLLVSHQHSLLPGTLAPLEGL